MLALEVVQIALDVRQSTLQIFKFLMKVVASTVFTLHEVCAFSEIIGKRSCAYNMRLLYLSRTSRAVLASIPTHVSRDALLVLDTSGLPCKTRR